MKSRSTTRIPRRPVIWSSNCIQTRPRRRPGSWRKARWMCTRYTRRSRARTESVRWLEVGQYFATAKLSNGDYEYSGSRTKVHFAVPQTFEWPVQFGGNIELDYMRRAAEGNPLSLELRPIAGANYKGFRLVANFAFEKPFSGPADASRGSIRSVGRADLRAQPMGFAGAGILRRHGTDSAAGKGA